MEGNISKEDIVKIILEEEIDNYDDEEAIHLLIDKKISSNSYNNKDKKMSFGEKMSDKLATFAGSWKFILVFLGIIICWIASNAFVLTKAFDPYPFILLNLILSCVAALQAPVIMMSQNRQEAKDRKRSLNDYKVNLKSELLTEDMHNKLDQIILTQSLILNRMEELEKNR